MNAIPGQHFRALVVGLSPADVGLFARHLLLATDAPVILLAPSLQRGDHWFRWIQKTV